MVRSQRSTAGCKVPAQYPQLVYIDKLEKRDRLSRHAGRVFSPASGEKFGADRLKVKLTRAGTGPFTFVELETGDHVNWPQRVRLGPRRIGLAAPLQGQAHLPRHPGLVELP